MTVVSVSLSLAGSPSITVVLTVAWFDAVPASSALTRMVTVAADPALSVPKLHVTVTPWRWQVADAGLDVVERWSTWLGRVSVTTTSVASFAPGFWTWIV
jgi:hypothetical protein